MIKSTPRKGTLMLLHNLKKIGVQAFREQAPFRVPIARLAAAQAAIKDRK